MSLRLKLIFAFTAVVSCMLVTAAASLYINGRVQTDLAGLNPSRGLDLGNVDLEEVSLAVSGSWDDGVFVASSVEAVPGRRRPKLRGEIQAVERGGRSITLYGIPISITDETEFVGAGAEGSQLADLKEGLRIEVSCRIVDGHCVARKIQLRGVKASDKIKGTATVEVVDGLAPRVLDVHGISVLLGAPASGGRAGLLRKIELTTELTFLLQETRAAAHGLVGRTLAWRDLDGAREIERDTHLFTTTEEWMIGAAADFTYYLERLQREAEQEADAGQALAFGRWSESLSESQPTFEIHLAELRRLALEDGQASRVYLDEVFDPFLQDDLLPRVYGYRAEIEEALDDRIQAISARAKATPMIALATSGTAVIIASVLGLLLWRTIDVPVRQLHAAALRLGEGHFDARVEFRSTDELGVLGDSFNQMAERIQRTTVSVSNLENVFNSMAGALIILDPRGRVTNLNHAALKLLGYDPGELSGTPFEKLCATRAHPLPRTTGDGLLAMEQKQLIRSDGGVVPISFSGAELRSIGGTLQGYVCVAQDLTEQKLIEERIRASLAEKELLLSEVHHRVKNNMQVISSLLEIQSSYVSDAEALDKFEQSRSRIHSMALIHEQLYQTSSFAELDLSGYLELLAVHLLQSCERHGSIRVDLQVADLPSNVDQALACGMILNELLTNALKHAFPAPATGKIRVSLEDEEDGSRVLTVSDDGCGISADVDLEASPTLGLRLVSSLVDQLHGSLSISSHRGTTFTVRFPVEPTTRNV